MTPNKSLHAPTDFRKYRAVTFDCYGTLIDWDTGVSTILAPWTVKVGLLLTMDDFLGQFADAQRVHQITDPFKPYRQVLADAFADVATANGHPADAEDLAAFSRSVGTWPPFSDTVWILRQLKKKYVLGVMSNVDDESFSATHKLLGGLIDEIITAEQVQSYKPAAPHFEEMLKRLAGKGISKEEVLHVAQSRFHDIEPANRLGLKTIWIDRRAPKRGRGITVASQAEPAYRFESLAEFFEATVSDA